MKAPAFIASKLSFRGRITVCATAVSFLVVIIAAAVSGGFRREISDGVSAIMGDVSLTSASAGGQHYGADTPIEASPGYLPQMLEVPGVEKITPAVYRAAIVKGGDNIQGVLFKGVGGADSTALQARIPKRLSDLLSLGVGDSFPAYFVGDKVKVRKFTVSEVYTSLADTGEQLLVFCSLPDLQRVNGWDSTQVSALEVALSPGKRTLEAEKLIAARLSDISMQGAAEGEEPLLATASQVRYRNLFDWLNLVDFNVLAIILLMSAVAGFNMISGLLIMMFRHTGTIGTLKALGMDNRSIAKTFLRVASRVVLLGMLVGNALALLFCLVQHKTHLLRLNPENYFVDFVPVSVNPAQVLLADAAVYALVMLLLLVPCLFISRVEPSTTLRVK